jgi:hypothetical protein
MVRPALQGGLNSYLERSVARIFGRDSCHSFIRVIRDLKMSGNEVAD